MGLEDALPRVLLPPVVVVVLRVHHPSHSVGGADGAKSENSSAHKVQTSHFFIATAQSLSHFSFCCLKDKPELLLVLIKSKSMHHEQQIISTNLAAPLQIKDE